MNVELNRHEIGNLLDRSADRLDGRTLRSLQHARQQALLHQRPAPSSWMNAGFVMSAVHQQVSQRALNWFFAAIVTALLLINLTNWYQTTGHDNVDVDIAILTDDLPVDVYVD